MFSKEESPQLKKEFWMAFAEAYPIKWLLYNTKIKDVAFKFDVDNKKAQVIYEIASKDQNLRTIYFEKIVSLKEILTQDYIDDLIFDQEVYLENKVVSRVYCQMDGISLHNKATWPQIFDFFNEKMMTFQMFFYEYEDYLKDTEINT
jgi:hypothetical protein